MGADEALPILLRDEADQPYLLPKTVYDSHRIDHEPILSAPDTLYYVDVEGGHSAFPRATIERCRFADQKRDELNAALAAGEQERQEAEVQGHQLMYPPQCPPGFHVAVNLGGM